jgi:hypothetical protein
VRIGGVQPDGGSSPASGRRFTQIHEFNLADAID